MQQAVHSTQNVSQLIKLDCKRVKPLDAMYAKIDSFYCSKKWHNKIPVGATWEHRPHNFLAVGAIAPMESAAAPM